MVGEILTAGAGFLLAVLWFDLIFDSQGFGAPRDEPLAEPILESIAGYYRRVTSDADPMGRVVGIAMMGTIAMVVVDLFAGSAPLGWRLVSVPLLVGPVLLAARRVFPNAKRLGARSDSPAEQSRLAREIARDHVACLAAILAFLAIQLFA